MRAMHEDKPVTQDPGDALRDAWWKKGIVYQIYPRSFQDSNGDGIGDLPGIRRRLDYLADLGVDAIWISPFYPSPMADFGYDVADYCEVDPRFGSLADFDALLAGVHARGMKLIVDFVPNHTSSSHPWFLESRASRDNPKRSWYLWRDPAPGGGPPNNWLSNFGGPAWTFDPASGQYYCHLFLKEQPDLNWRDPAVRAAMLEAMRFWLRRGVDGFRLDVIYHVVKDALFRDNPRNPAFVEGTDPVQRLLPVHSADRPEAMEIVAEMRRTVDAFSDADSARILVAETYLPIERLAAYYGRDATGKLRGAHLPFNFHLIGTPWNAAAIDRLVREYEAALPEGAAPNWVLGNHDRSRIASRVGAPSARLAAVLLLTLRGTPTLYYGDELGLEDAAVSREDVQDPFEKNLPGLGLGRDPVRTPMPWSDAPNAGFTTGRPWLRLHDDWRTRNVGAQAADAGSMLQFYRRLIALRRQRPALQEGAWLPLGVAGETLAYARVHAGEKIVVLLNFADRDAEAPNQLLEGVARVLLSTLPDRDGEITRAPRLRPFEGLILDT
jgi:alpha-glucosidase